MFLLLVVSTTLLVLGSCENKIPPEYFLPETCDGTVTYSLGSETPKTFEGFMLEKCETEVDCATLCYKIRFCHIAVYDSILSICSLSLQHQLSSNCERRDNNLTVLLTPVSQLPVKRFIHCVKCIESRNRTELHRNKPKFDPDKLEAAMVTAYIPKDFQLRSGVGSNGRKMTHLIVVLPDSNEVQINPNESGDGQRAKSADLLLRNDSNVEAKQQPIAPSVASYANSSMLNDLFGLLSNSQTDTPTITANYIAASNQPTLPVAVNLATLRVNLTTSYVQSVTYATVANSIRPVINSPGMTPPTAIPETTSNSPVTTVIITAAPYIPELNLNGPIATATVRELSTHTATTVATPTTIATTSASQAISPKIYFATSSSTVSPIPTTLATSTVSLANIPTSTSTVLLPTVSASTVYQTPQPSTVTPLTNLVTSPSPPITTGQISNIYTTTALRPNIVTSETKAPGTDRHLVDFGAQSNTSLTSAKPFSYVPTLINEPLILTTFARSGNDKFDALSKEMITMKSPIPAKITGILHNLDMTLFTKDNTKVTSPNATKVPVVVADTDVTDFPTEGTVQYSVEQGTTSKATLSTLSHPIPVINAQTSVQQVDLKTDIIESTDNISVIAAKISNSKDQIATKEYILAATTTAANPQPEPIKTASTIIVPNTTKETTTLSTTTNAVVEEVVTEFPEYLKKAKGISSTLPPYTILFIPPQASGHLTKIITNVTVRHTEQDKPKTSEIDVATATLPTSREFTTQTVQTNPQTVQSRPAPVYTLASTISFDTETTKIGTTVKRSEITLTELSEPEVTISSHAVESTTLPKKTKKYSTTTVTTTDNDIQSATESSKIYLTPSLPPTITTKPDSILLTSSQPNDSENVPTENINQETVEEGTTTKITTTHKRPKPRTKATKHKTVKTTTTTEAVTTEEINPETSGFVTPEIKPNLYETTNEPQFTDAPVSTSIIADVNQLNHKKKEFSLPLLLRQPKFELALSNVTARKLPKTFRIRFELLRDQPANFTSQVATTNGLIKSKNSVAMDDAKEKPLLMPTSNPIVVTSTQHQTNAKEPPQDLSEIMATVQRLTNVRGGTYKHSDVPVKIKHQPVDRNCSEDPFKPCSFSMGRDCLEQLDDPSGCFVCTCPYKSPARGCLGPAAVDQQLATRLLNKEIKCEDGSYAQPVSRYIRKLSDNSGEDDCVLITAPYCGFQFDVNTTRMPRTKDECYYYCYSDRELNAKDIRLKH